MLRLRDLPFCKRQDLACRQVADTGADHQCSAERLCRMHRAQVECIGNALTVEPVERIGIGWSGQHRSVLCIVYLVDVAACAVARAHLCLVGFRVQQFNLELVVLQYQHARLPVA